MNICKNCKYHAIGFRGGRWSSPVRSCFNEKVTGKPPSFNPVDGSKELFFSPCDDERTEKGSCGPEGKYFEQQKECTVGDVITALIKKLGGAK